MSLQPTVNDQIPDETARVARAAFPAGNLYLTMRDELGVLFCDEQFADLYPRRGQPAQAPWRLALVTLMQFAENLTDRQAAEAVRARIDWKYALGLGLADEGFDFSVLSEFRSRLIQGCAEQRLFETLLNLFKQRGLLKARGRQRTDSTHILAAVRELNRFGIVGETLRQALNVLAQVAPEWLRQQVQTEWFERYARRFDEYRLPTGEAERRAEAEAMGRDGGHLLEQIYAETAPPYLRHIPAVEVLRRVWLQHFYYDQDTLHWRNADEEPPAATLIATPYDPEARFCVKRETFWCGYKVHLTETCDAETPPLITQVETTPATEQDISVLDRVQEALATRDLLPSEHRLRFG